LIEFMPRKSNPEKDKTVSGAVPAKARRKATSARPRHSVAGAEASVSSVEVTETETVIVVSAVGAEPSQEEIARLAYLYWLDRGGEHGSAEEDWLRAEQELRQGSTTTH
jgi:hypothetical protein